MEKHRHSAQDRKQKAEQDQTGGGDQSGSAFGEGTGLISGMPAKKGCPPLKQDMAAFSFLSLFQEAFSFVAELTHAKNRDNSIEMQRKLPYIQLYSVPSTCPTIYIHMFHAFLMLLKCTFQADCRQHKRI